MVDRMSSTQLAGHANNYEYDIKLCGADSIMNRVVDVGIVINMVVLITFGSIMLPSAFKYNKYADECISLKKKITNTAFSVRECTKYRSDNPKATKQQVLDNTNIRTTNQMLADPTTVPRYNLNT